MSAVTVEDYSPERFSALAAFLSENARTHHAAPGLLLPGDLAWRLQDKSAAEGLVLFHDREGIAAYAWFDGPTDVEFDLRHDLPADGAVAAAVLAWSKARRLEEPAAYPRFVDLESMEDWAREVAHPAPQAECRHRHLTAVAFESRPDLIHTLQQHGFEPTRHFAPLYRRDLKNPVELPPDLPAGKVRAVTPADLDARVELHRSAWLGSAFDRERYLAVRASPAYDETLDLVHESKGELTSYCVCWADDTSEIGHFEPVGTRSTWRGRGAARAVILTGQQRLQERGMRFAQVATAGFNAPARKLYESCGFRRMDTLRTFMRTVEE